MALTQEQKDVKRLAKRILKAVKEPLEDAMRKEAELKGRELEEEMKKLDAMGIFASASKVLDMDGEISGESGTNTRPGTRNGKGRSASDVSANAGASLEDVEADADGDVEMEDGADERTDEAVIHLNVAGNEDTVPVPSSPRRRKRGTPTSQATDSTLSTHGNNAHTHKNSTSEKPTEPISPPTSSDDAISEAVVDSDDVFAHGGVPWYLEPFDPVGTTVHEERYTGRAVLRDMSEELSDMDEDTLTELAVNGVGEIPDGTPAKGPGAGVLAAKPSAGGMQKVPKKPKKKGRRQQWTRPRTR